MRIAIISDVHGNYPALVKVIEDADANNVDKFIFAGDYIFDFSFPNEVARLLMGLENAHIVKGNKEGYLNNLINSDPDGWTDKQLGSLYQTFRELSPDAVVFLNNLDEEIHIQLDTGHSIYAVHYPKNFKSSPKTNCSSSNFHKKMLESPFTHGEFLSDFNDLTNSEEYKTFVNQIDADIIIFGHNHLQAYGYCGDKLIINPGSCGQPLDFNTAAPYTILEITGDGFNITEKRVEYDIDYVVNQLKQSALYEKGIIWSELVILSLKMSRDYFGMFFELAREIEASKNEPQGGLFSDSTWEEAYEVFKKRQEIENRVV